MDRIGERYDSKEDSDLRAVGDLRDGEERGEGPRLTLQVFVSRLPLQ